MLKNPFVHWIEWENDPDDFKMPYTSYGNTDLEIMQDKYNKLTNRSKNPLIVRFKQN